MGVYAVLRHVRLSDQKAKLVVDQIRGVTVNVAFNLLIFSNKKASVIIKKLLKSVVSNAEHNNGWDVDDLKITEIYVNKAPNFKRFRARAKGRGNRITKRNCHIAITVDKL